VTYCVQAAANGTTLPVSVSASSVLGSTSGVAPAAGVLGNAFVNNSAISKLNTTTGTWEKAATDWGTPPAGTYFMCLQLTAAGATLANFAGAIVNETSGSVTPVLLQTQTICSGIDHGMPSGQRQWTTDGTKTLYLWVQSRGAAQTVTAALTLIRQ
jgi:hypothetical protein